MPALGLDVRDEDSKDFKLVNPKVSEDSLGHLRASRFSNKVGTRELVFYELTWSGIPFSKLRGKSLINERARAKDGEEEFSRLIRQGLPGVQ